MRRYDAEMCARLMGHALEPWEPTTAAGLDSATCRCMGVYCFARGDAAEFHDVRVPGEPCGARPGFDGDPSVREPER